LFWKKEVIIQQIFSAPKYIDVKILESPGKIWRLTGIYGEPRWEDKYKTWDKIRDLKANHDLPWLIFGDFNEILYSHEKDGGNPRPLNYMQAFRDVLIDCGLEDLGFSGDSFTWKRGRIRERLDRAVASDAWNIMHPGALVQHLDYVKSDHRPIMVDTEYQVIPNRRHKVRRFEAKWLRESGFNDVVQEAWSAASNASPVGGVLGKLGHLHEALHAWDEQVLKKPNKRLKKAQRELEKAMSGPISDESETIAKEKAALIELLLEQEEIHWLQRSRANWLQYGDRNSAFFHSFASARRKNFFYQETEK
jgi:hypothetical protein